MGKVTIDIEPTLTASTPTGSAEQTVIPVFASGQHEPEEPTEPTAEAHMHAAIRPVNQRNPQKIAQEEISAAIDLLPQSFHRCLQRHISQYRKLSNHYMQIVDLGTNGDSHQVLGTSILLGTAFVRAASLFCVCLFLQKGCRLSQADAETYATPTDPR